MQIEFKHDEGDFTDLADAWSRLLSQSATNTPFQRPSFQAAWWSTRGGGEWPQGELWLGAGRSQGGELAAIAPLFYEPDQRALMLIGSIEIADTLDLIGLASDLESFLPSLFQALEADGPPGWEAIDLCNLPEGSPTADVLESAASACGWRTERERLQPAPYLALGPTWEAYLEQIDSKQRRELKRKLRRASSYPMTVDWRLYQDGDDLAVWVNAFLDLMSLDPEKSVFLTEPMRRHFHTLAEAAAREGWLQIAMLDVGGQPAFGYFNFDYEDVLWIYNSGFDPGHAALSPGWVLMGNLIQWGIDHGRRGVDFLRGAEVYKYRLGGVDRYVERLRISRTSS